MNPTDVREGGQERAVAHPPTEVADRRLPLRTLLALAVIVILPVIAWSVRLGPYVGAGDDAIYLILGRDLAEEGRYRDRAVPGDPPHRQYPPGYPLIIATVLSWSGERSLLDIDVPLRALNVVFLLGSVPLALALQRGRERRAVVFASLFLWLFHPQTIELAGSVLTEVPYLFFSFVGILAFERLVLEGSETKVRGGLRWPVAAAALAWPVYVRVNGIALGVAAVATLMLRRRVRAGLLFGGLWLVMLLPLLVAMAGAGSSVGYAGFWSAKDIEGGGASPIAAGDLIYLLLQGARAYAGMLPDALFMWGKYGRPAFPVSLALAAGLLVVGLLGRLKTKCVFQEFYVLAFLLILVAFPIRSLRYLFPVFPFVTLYVVRGLDTVAQFVGPAMRVRRPEWIQVGALAAILLAGFASGLHFHRSEAAEAAIPPAKRVYGGWVPGQWEAIHWLGANSRPDAVAMTRKSNLLYLLTGRKSVSYPPTSAERVLQEVGRYRVQYIVEEPSEGAERHIRPAMERLLSQGRITLVYETSGRVPNRVWRVEREAREGSVVLPRGPRPANDSRGLVAEDRRAATR